MKIAVKIKFKCKVYALYWEATKDCSVGRALACKDKGPGFNNKSWSYIFHLKY